MRGVPRGSGAHPCGGGVLDRPGRHGRRPRRAATVRGRRGWRAGMRARRRHRVAGGRAVLGGGRAGVGGRGWLAGAGGRGGWRARRRASAGGRWRGGQEALLRCLGNDGCKATGGRGPRRSVLFGSAAPRIRVRQCHAKIGGAAGAAPSTVSDSGRR